MQRGAAVARQKDNNRNEAAKALGEKLTDNASDPESASSLVLALDFYPLNF